MKSRTIRCRSQSERSEHVTLTTDWVINALHSSSWFANKFLIDSDSDPSKPEVFIELSLTIFVTDKDVRLKRILGDRASKGKEVTDETMDALFDFSTDETSDYSILFSITWNEVEGIKSLRMKAPDKNNELRKMTMTGNEHVECALFALKYFSPGWVLDRRDKININVVGYTTDDLEGMAGFDSCAHQYEGYGWHPADYGLGPEQLSDDERETYYPNFF